MSKSNSNTVIVGKKMCKVEWEARFVVGKLRRGASSSRKDRLDCLGKIGIAMQRYGLNSIRDIKPGHVERFFAELRSRDMSAGRMANYASAMRALCNMMGKTGIVPSNYALGCSRDMPNRTKHANKRLDAEKAAEVREKLSPNNKIAWDMARNFGLRQKEALLSNAVSTRDNVECLVVQGAKGGRPRVVPITSEEQRAVLERNSAYRAAHGGMLIDENLSLKQGLKKAPE